jgi:nitrate reductase gamma subunit
MPAPINRTGVALRLMREVVLFESLFKASRWTWLFGWLFHAGLLVVAVGHLRYFLDPVWAPIVTLQMWMVPAGLSMVVGLAGLAARRCFVDRVRYISAPSDHLMLVLLLAITGSGLTMRVWSPTDVVALKGFIQSLLMGDPTGLPADFALVIHLCLASTLLPIFPFSKLLHAPGLFFSPTRNQVDNSREERHIASWATRLDGRD